MLMLRRRRYRDRHHFQNVYSIPRRHLRRLENHE